MGKPVQDLSSSTWVWEDPHGEHWEVTIDWAELDGRAECVGLALRSFIREGGRLRPVRPDVCEQVRPVRAEVLRAVPMALVEKGRAVIIEQLGATTEAAVRSACGKAGHPRPEDLEFSGLPPDGARRRWRELFAAPGTRRHLTGADGRPLPPREALVEVAAVYTEALQRSSSPTAAVAKTFNLSRSAAAKRVARARDAGLLPPTEQGRAKGGAPASRSMT